MFKIYKSINIYYNKEQKKVVYARTYAAPNNRVLHNGHNGHTCVKLQGRRDKSMNPKILDCKRVDTELPA